MTLKLWFSNVNMWPIGDKYYAITETTSMREINPVTLDRVENKIYYVWIYLSFVQYFALCPKFSIFEHIFYFWSNFRFFEQNFDFLLIKI